MRKLLFFLYNAAFNRKHKLNLAEIAQVNESNLSKQAQDFQKERIKFLIQQAVLNTNFYKKYSINDTIDAFNIINKNVIRENFEDFKNSRLDSGKLHKVSTSGSTGVPFVTYFNKEKALRNISDYIYFSQKCGYTFGQRLYYIRIWNEINKLPLIERKLKNIIPIHTGELSKEKLDSFLEELRRDKNQKSILSYASSLDVLVNLMETHKIETTASDYRIAAIFSMAEALSEKNRTYLEKALNTKVFARYSNSENGFIAHQVPGLGKNYLINKAGFVVEIFDVDSDKKLGYKQRGRIVITDLFNLAYPVIRYDTGDVGIMDVVEINRVEYEVLSHIEGRLMDFIKIDGKIISPHTIDYSLRSVEGLQQFQIIQKSEFMFELLLNMKSDPDSETKKMIVGKLKEYLGNNVQINIRLVTEIPVLKSGKRKIVISEI